MTVRFDADDFHRILVSPTAPIDNMFAATGGATWMAWHSPLTLGVFNSIGHLLFKLSTHAFSIDEFATSDFRLRFTANHSTTNGEWHSAIASAITVGPFFHLAVSWEEGDAQPAFYIDGVLQGTVTDTAPVGTLDDDSADDLFLGGDNLGGFIVDGSSGDFRTYAGKLSSTRIKNIANSHGRDSDVIGMAARWYLGPYVAGVNIATPVPEMGINNILGVVTGAAIQGLAGELSPRS